ncbi:hypothetical protein AXG93_2508s1110 [Marchantia polymorpha subsp. ruderalis]|uniref:Uncharacterized protein n=1 Tax=Marchantia polymorpha subsp. ruderalis TaxID=1480154 RepID=A0A176WD41_MARPO|nr:hypothetical protein AXG93_2508s1110 [Marchantia polymorpha subsp. ruderalis]
MVVVVEEEEERVRLLASQDYRFAGSWGFLNGTAHVESEIDENWEDWPIPWSSVNRGQLMKERALSDNERGDFSGISRLIVTISGGG